MAGQILLKRPFNTTFVAIGAALVLSLAVGVAVWQRHRGVGTVSASEAVPMTDLDRLVAPVALYPDQLLAQMLLCASDPPKVKALHDWLAANATLKGTELQDAALLADFEPSFVALAIFPDVIAKMAGDLDWTTRLGQAFAANRTAVFASIQRLRAQAAEAGTLKTSAQQDVQTTTTTGGEQVIVIEPANPQIVYVPQYDPQVVYVQSPPTTVVVQDNSANAAAAGLIGFTAGIAIGAAMDNDYYYGPYGWHGGVHMYNDAWDDWYDEREDARDDWQDHREDLVEERSDRAGNSQEQRTDRQENRQENRPDTEARQERRTEAQSKASTTQTRTSTAARETRQGTSEDRGNSSGRATATQRTGSSNDAFSGYSNGRSESSASTRGKQSRGASRSGGGGRRR
jgi:Protein of unknown function (DUF3300)